MRQGDQEKGGRRDYLRVLGASPGPTTVAPMLSIEGARRQRKHDEQKTTR